MEQAEHDRVQTFVALATKAERMAQVFYDFIAPASGKYSYAPTLTFERADQIRPNDFVIKLGSLALYARYKNIFTEVENELTCFGRYEVFEIEKNQYKAPSLSNLEIFHFDVNLKGHCIIDGNSERIIFGNFEAYLREDGQEALLGRIATCIFSSQFESRTTA